MRTLSGAIRKLLFLTLLDGSAWFGCAAVLGATAAATPACASSGQDLKSASQQFEQKVALSNDVTSATTVLRSGPEGFRVLLLWQDNVRRDLTLRPFDDTITDTNKAKIILKDAGIKLSLGTVCDYVRPNLARYPEKIRQDYSEHLEKWTELPSPLAYRFPIAFRMDAGGLAIWLDGRYAGRIDKPGKLKQIVFEVPPGSAIGETVLDATPANPKYLPLDIARLPAAREIAGVTNVLVSLAAANLIELVGQTNPAAGSGDILTCQPREGEWFAWFKNLFRGGAVRDMAAKIPFNLSASVWLDIGQTYRELGGSLGRSSFDGLKDSILVTVPAAQYIRAWMLCAVDDDPKKDPVVTARLTRFVEGSGKGRGRDAIADVTVKLPRGNEQPGPGIAQAGTLIGNGKTNIVWLVEVPLDIGAIQDLVWDEKPVRGTLKIGPYLDFELLGKLTAGAHPFHDKRWKPDPGSISGVKVLALTLEKTPVEMEVRQTQPGNIFDNDEKPELPVILRAGQDGKYSLCWSIRDVDGQKVGGGEKQLTMQAADGERQVIIPLQQTQLGWYGIDVELWQGGRLLIKYPAAFALLGADTRQAGFESPYGSWWFGMHHYGTPDFKIAGTLLRKLGFRRMHINNSSDRAKLSEEILAPWQLTDAMIPWVGGMKVKGDSDAQIEAHIRDHQKRFPHINYIMIFGESCPWSYRLAPELVNLAVTNELGAKGDYANADARWQQATWTAQLIREKFPDLKIIIGNSLGSTELIAEGLRRDFPEEFADYVGNEVVNRTGLPEKLWIAGTQCFWLQREIVRKYDYNWKVSTCFEYNYRQDRLIGQRNQAEWYVRDTLIALAYRSPYISTALLYDAGNDYQGSFWGGSGLCRRYPLLFPKKSYVGMAVLTRVLDRAQLRREFPTGSYSIYALEFDRPDGRKVYAIWASRGTGDLKIEFARAVDVEAIDMYGRSRKMSAGKAGLDLTAGTAAQYLITPVAAQKISCGKRTYPDDLPPAGLQVVNAMNNSTEWKLQKDIDPLLENTKGNMPYRTLGNYILRGVKDDEKGDCLEVELLPNVNLPALMNEYAVIRLKNPIELAGEPTTLGLWVKGNSGWGQVYWELEDANGVRRISCGTAEHNADVHDYDGRVSINFDGWNFLQFPVNAKSPIPDLSTGSVSNLWESADRSKSLAYPIKVTSIAVSLPPQALYLTEMNRIKQVLRFRDLSFYE